jgi:hypothetical protein
MRFALTLGACLLAASGALHAQSDKAAGDKAAKRPAAKDVRAQAAKACESTRAKGQIAYRDCVQRNLCAAAKDKKACEERFAKANAVQDKAASACASSKSKGEPAYQACLRRELCAQSPNPGRCETRAKAAANCEPLKGKGGAYGECLGRELCAQSENKPRCEARAKESAARQQRFHEACKTQKGDDYRACIAQRAREQRGKKK